MTRRAFWLALFSVLGTAGTLHGAEGLSRGPEATVQLAGKPFRGVGVNYFDCFLRTLEKPGDTSYEGGFATLQAKKIPFARFAACGYWPREMKLWRTDKAEYFRRLDAVVASARKHGVGLVASLFWHHACLPDLAGEPVNAWSRANSRTRALMRDYVRDVVTRYRDEPTLWAWELGNEYSLSAELPNAADHRPPVVPDRGTATSRSPADDLTYAMVHDVFTAYATEVRRHDPHRLIVSGDSFPRLSAWHLEHGKTWDHDTPAQFAEMLTRANPDPLDGISLHAYEDDDQRFAGAMAVAKKLGKPLFVGEFGAPGTDSAADAKFRRLLAAIVSHRVPLAAVWVFDFPAQPDLDIIPGNARAWQLDAIAQANRELTND